MKKVLFLFIIVTILISFTSCSKSGKKLEEKNKQTIVDSTEHSEKIFTLVDTPHDTYIRKLKKLPEYKNAIFLSPKESKEYLSLLMKNEKRFLRDTRYTEYHDTKGGYLFSLQISIDTTQSMRPIARWSSYFYFAEGDSSFTDIKLYYLPKLKVIYLKQSVDRRTWMGDYTIFDDQIRKEFPNEKQ